MFTNKCNQELIPLINLYFPLYNFYIIYKYNNSILIITTGIPLMAY